MPPTNSDKSAGATPEKISTKPITATAATTTPVGTKPGAKADARTDSKPDTKPTKSQTWDKVCEPGAYVCHDTGRLLRVPQSALSAGNAPAIQMFGPAGPPTVTRLSENANLPIDHLRDRSSKASIKPQF